MRSKYQILLYYVLINIQLVKLDNFDIFFLRHNVSDKGRKQRVERVGCDTVKSARIVGGNEVKSIENFPYHLQYGKYCSGVILAPTWAITAAHCGIKKFVRAGSKYIHQGQLVYVDHHFPHPSWSLHYKNHVFDNDFMLLRLKDPLKFSNSIMAIKIGNSEDLRVGMNILVTGWGRVKDDGEPSQVLRVVAVPTVSRSACQRVPYDNFKGTITPNMFCAGSDGKDACQGDSGGPAVMDRRLHGLVSFGHKCAHPNAYGVYSKVTKAKGWIKLVTHLNFD